MRLSSRGVSISGFSPIPDRRNDGVPSWLTMATTACRDFGDRRSRHWRVGHSFNGSQDIEHLARIAIQCQSGCCRAVSFCATPNVHWPAYVLRCICPEPANVVGASIMDFASHCPVNQVSLRRRHASSTVHRLRRVFESSEAAYSVHFLDEFKGQG